MITEPGKMHHYVDVIGPADVSTSRGQQQSQVTLMTSVPCEIEVLSGREAEIARQMLPSAQTRITMRGPIKDFVARCVLIEKSNGHRHHVGYIEDPTRVGRLYRCLCTEEMAT